MCSSWMIGTSIFCLYYILMSWVFVWLENLFFMTKILLIVYKLVLDKFTIPFDKSTANECKFTIPIYIKNVVFTICSINGVSFVTYILEPMAPCVLQKY